MGLVSFWNSILFYIIYLVFVDGVFLGRSGKQNNNTKINTLIGVSYKRVRHVLVLDINTNHFRIKWVLVEVVMT